jgi:hypothetical protein
MVGNEPLSVLVEERGVFVRFQTSDGSEACLDMIAMATQSGPVFGPILLTWCRDRISASPSDLHAQLMAQTATASQRMAASELEQSTNCNGAHRPINHEWLDDQELRADGVTEVMLRSDELLDLLAVARNGLRPKAVT